MSRHPASNPRNLLYVFVIEYWCDGHLATMRIAVHAKTVQDARRNVVKESGIEPFDITTIKLESVKAG